MKRSGISHATLMLLVCSLPLLVFFALALAGVQLNPLWVPLIMILCCLAMFFLTAGACHHEPAERIAEAVPEEPTAPPAGALKTEDVFRVHHSRRVGGAVVQEGKLLRDPDEAYAEELADHMHGGIGVGSSALLALIAKLALGDTLAEGHRLLLHPLAFAGWLGLLVTALNLLPIGQLDGGHIADAMFGRARSAAIGTAALFALVFLGLFVWSGLLTWAFIVYFIAGGKGLPPLNDIGRLGAGRMAVGVFAFVLLVLILMPVPHRFYDALGIHCPYL